MSRSACATSQSRAAPRGRVDAGHLGARVGEQFEHADQHAVVAQHVLLGDALAQRHEFVAVLFRHAPGAAVVAVGLAHLGARVDRRLGGARQRLAVDALGARHARRAPVEQGQLEGDLRTTRCTGAWFEPLHGRARTHRRSASRGSRPSALAVCSVAGARPCTSRRCAMTRRSISGSRAAWPGDRAGARAGGTRLLTRRAQQPRQALARRALRLLPRASQCRLALEGLLAHICSADEVAGRGHAPRQLRARLAGAQHLPAA